MRTWTTSKKHSYICRKYFLLPKLKPNITSKHQEKCVCSFVFAVLGSEWYIVIRAEICEACPKLADTLIHLGNADHGLIQEVSIFQVWRRMFNLIQDDPELDEAEWVKQSARGFSHEMGRCAEFMTQFVIRHSDTDGGMLAELERFEQRIASSRKIPSTLFRQLGDIPPHVLRRTWSVPLIKAVLSAPKSFQLSLFTTQDISEAKLNGMKEDIASATGYIASAKLYIKAHLVPQKMSELVGQKLIDDLE